jgi:hypothetical protein
MNNCPVCLNSCHEPQLILCHFLCKDCCIEISLRENKYKKCPLCRKNIAKELKKMEEDDDKFDYKNSCDCCLRSWNESNPNEFGICLCCCSNCDKLLRDCKYTCRIY